MNNKRVKFPSVMLAFAILIGLSSVTQQAAADNYTVTIPSTLEVTNSGWNALDGGIQISIPDVGKKLVVTVSSTNNFNFVSETEQTVSYNFCASSEDLTTAVTSWDFTSMTSNSSTTKTAGINVADYSSKPAGTYTETVTFTTAIQSLDKKTLTALDVNNEYGGNKTFYYHEGQTWRQAINSYSSDNSGWTVDDIGSYIKWNGNVAYLMSGDTMTPYSPDDVIDTTKTLELF